MSILTDLSDPQIRRSKAATKLAAYISAQAETVVSMPIAALALAVGVSEPTVNRFCTGLGFSGFPDFKLNLAAELARQEPSIARDVHGDDSVGEVIDKIFETTHASLQEARQQLDIDAVDRAVTLLNSARSITLCGAGASASVALDAKHKLLRFPIPVTAHSDSLDQRVAATTLAPDDCLVCISYTGRTVDISEVAQLGRKTRASVLGITAADSPLAAHCDLVLPVAGGEDTELYTPMSSRIAQLVVIDILTTCMAMARGDAFSATLAEVKRNLGATRYHKASP